MDSRDSLIILLKEKYEHEYNKKKYFEDTLPVPITLLTALVAGIYLIINDKTKIIAPAYIYIWIGLLVLLFASCILSVYFLYRVYIKFGSTFSSFPMSSEIFKYYNDLKIHHEHETYFNEKIENDLKDAIIDWYVNANTVNTNINDKRANSYTWARICLFTSVSLGILVFLIISITKLSDMAKKQQPSTPPPPAVKSSKPAPKPPQIRVEKFSKGGTIKKK
jgi:hypothetical protein